MCIDFNTGTLLIYLYGKIVFNRQFYVRSIFGARVPINVPYFFTKFLKYLIKIKIRVRERLGLVLVIKTFEH
jgi:hypothetical protein